MWWRDALDEMEAMDHRLTDWEREFLDNMHDWAGRPTERQAAVLEKIAEKLGIDIELE